MNTYTVTIEHTIRAWSADEARDLVAQMCHTDPRIAVVGPITLTDEYPSTTTIRARLHAIFGVSQPTITAPKFRVTAVHFPDNPDSACPGSTFAQARWSTNRVGEFNPLTREALTELERVGIDKVQVTLTTTWSPARTMEIGVTYLREGVTS